MGFTVVHKSSDVNFAVEQCVRVRKREEKLYFMANLCLNGRFSMDILGTMPDWNIRRDILMFGSNWETYIALLTHEHNP